MTDGTASTAPAAPPAGAGRARTATDGKISSAALELLRAKGPAAVTIDGVAARSGVARTTIYRRFTDRREMLADALLTIGAAEYGPFVGSERDRLRAVVDAAGALIFDGIGLGGIAALITGTDPAFTRVFRDILHVHHATLAESLAGSEDGVTMRTGLPIETLVDVVVGLLVAEFARTGTIGDGWRERAFTLLEPLIAGTSGEAG